MISAVAPVVIAEVAKGGLSGIEKDAETLAGLVLGEVLDQADAPGADRRGDPKLLGIK